MRILSWNIRKGGRKRQEKIVESIVSHRPEIAILSEYLDGSEAIGTYLDSAGYKQIGTTNLSQSSSGIAVFSRISGIASPHEFDGLKRRWLTVDLGTPRIRIGAVHVPGVGDKTAGITKAETWEAILRFAAREKHRNTLIIGDLNTGLPKVDERGSTFACVRQFRDLSKLGFVDAWRLYNGAKSEYSWYSNFGNGFRLDHAFVSATLSVFPLRCSYSHIEREEKLSDHSIMLLDLSMA